MSSLLTGVMVISLTAITIEDFKKRMIWWGWIPILCFTGIGLALAEIPVTEFFQYATFNLGFILLQLILVTGWFSIRNRKLINISKEHLGIGDILFFLPLCLLFSPINFILFYLSSIICILTGYLIFKFISSSKTNTIPLAGGISVFVICFFVGNFFLSCNRYSDDNILNYLAIHFNYLLIHN